MTKEIKQYAVTVFLSTTGFFLAKLVEDNASFKLDNGILDNAVQVALHILPYALFWSGLIFIPMGIIMRKIGKIERDIVSLSEGPIESTIDIRQDLQVVLAILTFWKREIRLKAHSDGSNFFLRHEFKWLATTAMG